MIIRHYAVIYPLNKEVWLWDHAVRGINTRVEYEFVDGAGTQADPYVKNINTGGVGDVQARPLVIAYLGRKR